jgi:hypothetical protein
MAHKSKRKLLLVRACAKLLLRALTSTTRMNKKMQTKNVQLFQQPRMFFADILNDIYAASLLAVGLGFFSTVTFATDNLQRDPLFEGRPKHDLCISASIASNKLTDKALREIVEKQIISDRADRDKDMRREALKAALEIEANKTNLLQIKLLKPGMTLKVVQDLYPFAQCSEGTSANKVAECKYTANLLTKADKTHLELETFGGYAVREWSIQFFPSDKLVSAVALLDPSAFDDVAKAIEVKFGKASSFTIEEFQNGFGAKFKGRTLIWKKQGTALEVQEFASVHDTMLIAIYGSVTRR